MDIEHLAEISFTSFDTATYFFQERRKELHRLKKNTQTGREPAETFTKGRRFLKRKNRTI